MSFIAVTNVKTRTNRTQVRFLFRVVVAILAHSKNESESKIKLQQHLCGGKTVQMCECKLRVYSVRFRLSRS